MARYSEREPYTYWWIAKRSCGRLYAVCPEGPNNQRLLLDRLLEWRSRGLTLSSVPVKDPLPPSACPIGKPCACRDEENTSVRVRYVHADDETIDDERAL